MREKNKIRSVGSKDKEIITIIAGGDIQCDDTPWDISVYPRKNKWLDRYFPLTTKKNFPIVDYTLLTKQNKPKIFLDAIACFHFASRLNEFNEQVDEDPFKKIKMLLSSADISIFNLESPLTNLPRKQDAVTPSGKLLKRLAANPKYAQIMADAGVTIVSIANNHSLDLGVKGLIDTFINLRRAGIQCIGGGLNQGEARDPVIIQKDGCSIAFLGYTQYCNHGFNSVAGENPGILPFSTVMIIEDIRKAKEKYDFVFLSLHWDLYYQKRIHPKTIKYAHEFIDAGADCIMGHHAKTPKAIEIYKEKPIFYSLGNFMSRYYDTRWKDNFIARINIQNKKLYSVDVFPVSGTKEGVFQPELLEGLRARSVLQFLMRESKKRKTKIVSNGAYASVVF